MAKCGSTPMPVSPGSSNRIELRFVSRSRSRVVHCWPVTLRYCRSSWQTAQAASGCSLSACCVPQVVQMKFVIARHPPLLFVEGWPCRSPSAPDPLDLVAQSLQFGDDALSLVALNLDPPVFDCTTGPAPLLERSGKFPQAALVQLQVEYC